MNIIVIGALNTDIIASGLERFLHPGEHGYAPEITIVPGGKSRNIAAMVANLTPPKTVAMMSHTAKDSYGLYKLPLDALAQVDVDISAVIIDESTDKLPGIALIPVTKSGENQIIVAPGASADFAPSDVDTHETLFETAKVLIITLECPLPTVRRAVQLAQKHNLRIFFDPGGIEAGKNYDDLVAASWLLKPNEHEAQILTGVTVTDLESASEAAKILQQKSATNVLFTHGKNGAYLFEADKPPLHISIPEIPASETKDATGCGDQTMAALVAKISIDTTLAEAARTAIRAGTLQFHRAGVQPLTKSDVFSN